MQDIWITRIEWEEFLPEELAKEIQRMHGFLNLKNLSRFLEVYTKEKVIKSVFHSFVDASQKAMCIYEIRI